MHANAVKYQDPTTTMQNNNNKHDTKMHSSVVAGLGEVCAAFRMLSCCLGMIPSGLWILSCRLGILGQMSCLLWLVLLPYCFDHPTIQVLFPDCAWTWLISYCPARIAAKLRLPKCATQFTASSQLGIVIYQKIYAKKGRKQFHTG